ncbi:DUF374 domain-containing protein [Candidatus Babeliales bacterium]|nr:DUF374 domain-containing protein [Candidatus Babeliales bacterium]
MSRTTTLKLYLKKLKNYTILRSIVKYLTYFYTIVLFSTYHLKVKYDYKFDKPFNELEGVFYFWNQNIIAALFFFSRNKNIGHCLLSTSKDGKIIGFIIKKLGFKIIYGSSYKKSLKTIRQTLDVLEINKKLATTGDGSRGPAFKLQRRVIYLASKSKLPLIFIDCKSECVITFKKSWNKFQIPLPFSKILVRIHAPVIPSSDAYKRF